MTGKKKYCTTTMLFALSVGMMTQLEVANAVAADASQTNVSAVEISGDTSPEFTNLDEALRAADLARETVTASSNLKESLTNVENAQASVDKALKSGDPNALAKASMALEKAEEAFMRNLADDSGVIEGDILSMRDRGMEWWQVGHELGMHSDMIGHGHNGERQQYRERMGDFGKVDAQELSEATEINSRHGWSQGHGRGIQAGVRESGAGFMSMNQWNSSDSNGMSGAGGMQHRGVSGNNWGGHNSTDDKNDNHNGSMNNNMNNNMNDNHNGNMNNNMNNNMNDNHNGNMNNNMNDNHNSNNNNNMNDNHNGNMNNNMNDNHNSNSGGWGGDSGRSSGGHGGRGKW